MGDFLVTAQKDTQSISAERLQGELVNAKSKKTGLDKALDDVENGLVSGPFNSADELFKHLNV